MNGATMNTSEAIELLVKYDIGPTQQRIRIAKVMCSSPRHLSAEQILDEVNSDRSFVSKATIYNTLNLFVAKGLVRQVIVDPSKIFYDSTTNPHFHFFHEDTGILEDIPHGAINLDHVPALPVGTLLAGVDVIVRVRSQNAA